MVDEIRNNNSPQEVGGKTLSDVVEQLKELNEATEMVQESVAYTQELKAYLEREGHNLNAEQLYAIEDLIQVLKEGRLDELEAEKEQMLRARVEEKRDKQRNDLLEKISKFTGISMDLLEKEFGGKDRSVIMGIIIRTAMLGLLKGFIVGLLEPFKLIGKGFVAISSKIGKALQLDKFYGNLKLSLQTQITKAFDFFKNAFKSRPGQPPAFLAKAFAGTKLLFKDIFEVIRLSGGNILKIMTATTGFIAGRFGALESLTKLNFKPKLVSKFFNMIANGVNAFFKPIRDLGKATNSILLPVAKTLNKAGSNVKGASAGLGRVGTNILRFLKNFKLFEASFSVLGKIGGIFVGIGRVLGRFFYVISGIWGAITGFYKGFKKYEDGNLFEQFLSGVAGAFTGIVNAIVTSLLDLVKDGISWVSRKLGFENFANMLDSFSFEALFTKFMDSLVDLIIGTFRKITDMVQDIGVTGIIKNVVIDLIKIFKKLGTFPVAIVAGGLGALAAALPGGKTPMEGFKENFNKVFNAGDDVLNNLKTKADGLNSEGNLIDARSEEGKLLRQQRELERGEGPAISQAIYNTQQKAGDIVNVVQSASSNAVNTVGGILSNVYS